MYLAYKKIKGKTRYIIRESYRKKDGLHSRDLFDLGENPGRYIIYPGGKAFYIDEIVATHLRGAGLEPAAIELDELFRPFLRPECRRLMDQFGAARRPRPGIMSPAEEEEIHTRVHAFDKRRLHFLRYGQVDQGPVDHIPAKLCRVLLGKSRDELEQFFLKMERVLKNSEVKTYAYVIFDLQRFFRGLPARTMPAGLPDQDKVDEKFLEELCRLNHDRTFWTGMPITDSLHDYLQRYVIMFFDFEFAGLTEAEYLRDFINRRRQYRTPPPQSPVGATETSELFGEKFDDLRKMSRRDLVRLYRRKAKKLHPDKGGEHETFVKLTAAYKALLAAKPHG